MTEEQIKRALELFEAELRNPKHISTSTLFGIEVPLAGESVEWAMSLLFRYASAGGWDAEYDDAPETPPWNHQKRD